MTTFVDDFGQELVHVHEAGACVGRCPIHNPSDHHMRDWPLRWRADRGLFERECPHGIGHPDPDGLLYVSEHLGRDGEGVHGCDGCCAPPERAS